MLRILPLAVVLLCLSGCDQDPGAPSQAVDLAVAAQLWITPEKQWSQVELQQLLEGERLYHKRCAVVICPAVKGS